MNQPAETIQQRIRFEEVSPANIGAAFLDASIESLVVPLGLPIYEGYDGLDDLRLTFLTLPSGETVTLATYLNSPQLGTSIHANAGIDEVMKRYLTLKGAIFVDNPGGGRFESKIPVTC
jgi:hypothetical protein